MLGSILGYLYFGKLPYSTEKQWLLLRALRVPGFGLRVLKDWNASPAYPKLRTFKPHP